jgi:uncharacterized repeat protein (TIGR03803 family)
MSRRSQALLAAGILLLLATRTLAATKKVLYAFKGGSDGSVPWSRVIVVDGKLFGTTVNGGKYGYGTVYELTPGSTGWEKAILHSFAGGSDGAYPYGELAADASGNLYGTTNGGNGKGEGYGTIFELSPGSGGTWTENVLHTFTGADGSFSYAGLALDMSGNLYGTTYDNGPGHYGTVFELSPSGGLWTMTTLHSFTGSDGAFPEAPLLITDDGTLYGTTSGGGQGNGSGTLFKLSPSNGGWLFATLYTFSWYLDGDPGYGSVILGEAGNIYGTTSYGGTGSGTAYKLTPSDNGWTASVIYKFGRNGGYPSGVIFGPDGGLYGTQAEFGPAFELIHEKHSWREKALCYFTRKSGDFPVSGLTLGPDGELYGTTTRGGTTDSGVVFEITP